MLYRRISSAKVKLLFHVQSVKSLELLHSGPRLKQLSEQQQLSQCSRCMELLTYGYITNEILGLFKEVSKSKNEK